MAFEINFKEANPNVLVLGQSKEVEVKYKIVTDEEQKFTAKFTSRGGFTISGTSQFNHQISSDTDFEKQITLVAGTSVGQVFQLQLEVCDQQNHCIARTRSINIIAGQTARLLANRSVDSGEFSTATGDTMSKHFRYKILKDNNFKYNRSTRKWEKK